MKIKINEDKKQETDIQNQKIADNRRLAFDLNYPNGLTDMFPNSPYVCPKCRNYESTPKNIFGADIFHDIYSLRNDINCLNCHSNSILNTQENTLKQLIEILNMNAFNNVNLTLGSKTNVGTVSMKENQVNDIYFEDMGIPLNAKILDIHLTPSCHLFPLKLMSNNTRYVQDVRDNKFSFFPANITNQEKTDEKNGLSIMVQWLLFDDNNTLDNNLLDAIDNFIDNKPYELIMNANRSLELICNQICYKEFVKNNNNSNGKKSVEDFLVTGATYGHQLSHLMTLISKANSLTIIEKTLITKMNWLRKLRNDIAHRGKLKDNRELTKNEKIEILAIAILGSSLLKYIFKKL